MSQPPTTHLRPEPTNPKLVDELKRRIQSDLAASFDPAGSLTVAYAPARIEAMGKITDYCGSKYVAVPASVGTAVAIQRRRDKQVSIFSFDLYDQHKPFTLIAPLKALTSDHKALRNEFAEPGRTWAGYVAGVLAILHEQKLIDLDQIEEGFNIAILGDVQMGMGLGSSASLITASLNAFEISLDLFLQSKPTLCQMVENQIIGLSSGPLDFELIPEVKSFDTFQLVGVATGKPFLHDLKKHQRLRCAAFIAHKLILEKMRQLGKAADRELIRDPMSGMLANLSLDDYRKYFRSYVPEEIKGGHFLLEYGKTIDPLSAIEPDYLYNPQKAADFHLFQANRIKNYITFLNQPDKPNELNKAGHLMYAAHISYREEAEINDPNCDLLIELVKQNEPAGLYGAKIAGHGGGVTILCDKSDRADQAMSDIMATYKTKTELTPIRINPCQ